MCIARLLRLATAGMRRRAALGLFRLASMVLRSTTHLYERQLIPRAGVKAALAVSGVLERGARALLPGLHQGRHRDGCKEVRL